MRYDADAACSDWVLLETVLQGGSCPCSDEYANANDEELADVYAALRLLQAAGCPPDETRGNPRTEHVGKYKVPGRPPQTISVFVLKAKPSGWRLYFFIRDRHRRQVEFIYAVNKKRWKRDPADFKHCCRILERIRTGGATRQPLYLPPR